MGGTSPRMRGKPDDDVIEAVQKRNIPAYAGKTFVTGKDAFFMAEHPRVCGENLIIESHKLSPSGTSPRMRGKPLLDDYSRVTPVEHPRVCGENFIQAFLKSDISGPSPRQRGKRKPQRISSSVDRNIPAYAGKTSPKPAANSPDTEHPRVCGENFIAKISFISLAGTSPRMRGKRKCK